jgi:3-phosphoshikimate 1-carboxyvinyltransferase
MDITVLPGALTGTVRVPPSKSAAHRAIIAAALAEGTSVVRNVDLSSDIRATLDACAQLGCAVDIARQERCRTLTIRGGLKPQSGAVIDCAESGSTLRFMIPVACAYEGERTFTGRGRLPQRPIDAYLRIFGGQGIAYNRPYGANLPLTVTGALKPGIFRLDGRVSSQFVTGLLCALPLLEGGSRIEVIGGLESRGYVDLTVDMLRRFGVQTSCEGDNFSVRGNQAYIPQRLEVEGDYSQAAFFLVAGAISGGLRVEGLAPASLQPDRAIVDILSRMGAGLTREADTVIARPSRLAGVDVDVSQCPDLVPPLAVAAAFARGTTRIMGAARLRIKESDRLHALAQNLSALGVLTEEEQDGLIIHGGEIQGGEVDSFGDHRIAMAFSVAAAASKQGVTIRGAQCVDKSYPGFYEDFAKLGGKFE